MELFHIENVSHKTKLKRNYADIQNNPQTLMHPAAPPYMKI